jgi:predicted 3-demethylubiquinone-9 3-methyltransferase (glyoxalase superfamily)
MPVISTFLMFDGKAEEAMRAYVALFPGSAVTRISRYGAHEGTKPGAVRHATFTLAGREFQCIDTPVPHAFTFTPAASIHVAFADAAELDRVYEALASGGQVMMPLDAYPFSRRYAWLNDRFGVSWQLALA